MLNKILQKYRALPMQVRASFWFLICSFVQKAISSITTPIFTRLLTTEEYGRYSVFNSWLTIITIFVTLNLFGGVYVQGLVKFEDKKREFSSALQGLTLTLCLLWLAIYLLFRSFWNQLFSLTTVQMLAMLVMIWTSAVFVFWAAEQRVELKYRKLVIVSIVVSLAKPLVGVFFVLFAEDKVTARIIGLALVELVGYTGLFFAQMRRGRRFCSKTFWVYALRFNLPLIPHYLSTSVLSGADRIMISQMVGDAQAGIYNLAYSISLLMTMFNTALLQTMEPWLYKKIKTNMLEEIGKMAYPAFGAIAGVNVALIAFAPEVVALFAPSAYYDAIWIIPAVAMSTYFTFAYTFFAVFEFYYEETRFVAVATTVSAVLNLVLNYIFIDVFGYYAAGYTTLVCYILYALMHYSFMRIVCKKYCGGKYPYNVKALLAITFLLIAIGFGFMALYPFLIARYLCIISLSLICIWKRQYIIKKAKELISIREKRNAM